MARIELFFNELMFSEMSIKERRLDAKRHGIQIAQSALSIFVKLGVCDHA